MGYVRNKILSIKSSMILSIIMAKKGLFVRNTIQYVLFPSLLIVSLATVYLIGFNHGWDLRDLEAKVEAALLLKGIKITHTVLPRK